MSYIQPNGELYLLAGVPLDSSYQHTILFTSASVQAQYFMSLTMANGAFSALSYTRPEVGIVRLEGNPEAFYACNYIMFRNVAYGTKWFYGFVSQVEYISDKCLQVRFDIDVIQTWLFEANLSPCLVEREHSVTDKIGDNIVLEGLEMGPIICSSVGSNYVIDDYCIVQAFAGTGSDSSGEDEEEE